MNRPTVLVDPSGHVGCGGKNWDDGPQCKGKQEFKQKAAIELKLWRDRDRYEMRLGGLSDDGFSNIVNTLWDRYKLGWTNFGTAWSIAQRTPIGSSAWWSASGYVAGWGGAHLGLALGLIALGLDTSRDQQFEGYAPSPEGSRGPLKSPFGSPDLSQPPGDDWEWRTRDPEANPPGSNRGAWQSGDQQLHNDPYEKTFGPHVDYTDPDGNEWRIWPDGSMSPKYPK